MNNGNSMTAPTPEEMRALAQRNEWTAREPGLHLESAAALRAAANQLEAVQKWVEEHYRQFREISELNAALTADRALEDRDE